MPPVDPMSMMGGMPPVDPMMGGMGAPAPAPRPIDAVLAAIGAMGEERTAEDDAVLKAVLSALGIGQSMPSGMEGVTEGAPFASPDMAGGGY